jgi:hypothetical protein
MLCSATLRSGESYVLGNKNQWSMCFTKGLDVSINMEGKKMMGFIKKTKVKK